MSKAYAEANAKKKKKDEYKQTPKTGSTTPSQSSSVESVNERSKNSTFLGGGTPVTRTEERRNQGPSASKLSDVERRAQKTYGTTKPELRTKEQAVADRAARKAVVAERRTQAQAVKSGKYATRENATGWDRDIADTMEHTLKQIKASDLRMLNQSMKGITQKDAWLYTTEEQRRKADEKVKQRDERYAKQIDTETEALEKIKEGHGYLGQQALSAVSSATGMAVDLGLGALTGGAGLAHMGIRSTGGSMGEVQKKADALRNQLKSTGYYTDDQLDEMFKNVNGMDLANAAASGGIEVISELFFRGFGPVAKYVGGSSIAEKVGAKLFKKAESKLGGGLVKNALKGTAEEVAEEEIGGPMQAWASNIIYGKKFQGYNEDVVKQALTDQSNAMRSQINSEVDAQQAAARLNSPAFMDESIQTYIDSGYSKEEATKLAEMSRDYLAAALSGDVDGMKVTQDAMVDMLTGGENSMKAKFTLQDAIDAAVSTSMMTLPTGLPGAMSTMQIGNAYKENIGLDAVKQQAEMILNWGSEEDESKAQAVIDHIDNGNDMTGTQVYEIVQKAGEVAAEGKEVEITRDQVAEKQMRKLDLRIDPRNPDGTLAPQTEQRYEEIVTKTMSKYSALARIGESSGYSAEDIELGADIGASFETGVISSEQVNELAKGNEAVREVFHDVTGIDLNQFENNKQMRDALMAKAADNLVNSARIEQIAWNDEVKGGVADSLSKGIGGSGDTAVQKVLETVDPRDRNTFLLTADVARAVYDRARNTEESWNDTKRIFREMYPSVDMDVMRDVYNAAKEDKAKGEAYYGKVVTAGDKATRSSLNGADTAYVAGKFTDKRQNKEGKSLQEESLLKSIAKAFDINIDVVDDLASVRRDSNGYPILDSEGNPLYKQDNGLFDPKTSTLILNAHPDATRTITQTMAHELTHHIAVHAPDEYVKLQKYIMDAWYRQDANRFNREINRIKALYKAQKNQDLTTEQALEELIADGAADFDWSDEKFIADVTVNEPTLAQKIIDAIKDVLRRIRSILASGDVIDPASTEALYAKAIEFDTVRSMWVKAAQMARNDRAQKAIDEYQDNINVASQATFDSNNGNIMSREEIRNSLVENFDDYKDDKTNLDIAVDAISNLYDQQLSWVDYLEDEQDDGQESKRQTSAQIPIGQLTWDDLDWSDESDEESADGQVPSLRRNKENNSGIRTVGRRLPIPEEIIKKGYVDFRGHKISKPEDLAKLCQVLRNPMFETSRIFYMKGDTIVGHRAVSSRLPMQSAGTYAKGVQYFSEEGKYQKDVMSQLGADGYFIMHNHPSGHVSASGADKSITKAFQNYVPGLRGHIILDHDKFGWITPSGHASERPIPGITGEDTNFIPSIENEHLGLVWKGKPEEIAEIGRDVIQSKDGYSVVVYMNAYLEVNEIQEINNKVILNDKNFANFIKNENTRAGSGRAVIYTTDSKVKKFSESLVKTKHFEGIIYEQTPGKIAFSGGKHISAWGTTIPQKRDYIEGGTKSSKSRTWYQDRQVRFSVSEPVEQVRDLIAVHNLKPEDIRNTFELGGFPMPSIAITKDSMGHDMYGDISLLFGSDTIDPKFFRSNQVFGGDAYTPTFPATQYKPNEDIVEKFRDIYYDNAKTLGYDAMRPFYELAEDAENALNRNGGEQGLIDKYKNDIRAMRTFLKINGKDVEDVVKRTEDTISETEQKLRQHFIDTLGEDAIREFEGESIPHGKAMMDHRKNWTYEHSDEIKSAYKDFLSREFSFSDEEISNVLDNMSLFETMKLVRNALNYLNNGATTVKEEVDRAATDEAIENAAHELGFEEWIDGLLTGIEEKRGIRNDKEFFTRNGNRRSWDTLHDDITLENVVKVMRSELAAGGNGFLWKNPKGAAQKQYKSLDEIRADEDRLQQLPEEEYKALEQAATQKLSDVLSDVVDSNPGRFMNSFGAVLDTGEYIAEILNETRDKDTMQRKLKKDYSLEVSDEQMDRIAEAIEEIANIPTGYFEAKPRRAVGFDEVKAAIVPASMDEDIKQGFQERNITMYEYDPAVEGDRTAKVNEAATEQDIRFSITDSEGNGLSEGQEIFFANSKNRDSEDHLKVMFHGTQDEFYEFDPSKAKNGTLGRAFYFTDSASHAGTYGNAYKYYLNLENPLQGDTRNITKDQLRRFVAELAENEDYGIENYGANATVDSVTDSVWGGTDFQMLRDLNLSAVGDFAEALKVFNRVNGTDYDGIITPIETVAFYPQQIKSIDNLNPTLSKDTRYSLTDSNGKELTDDQVEYFKNSQARDEQGRLVPVYHTTNYGGFTIFDPAYSDDKRSLFFASNFDVSQTYGKHSNARIYTFDIRDENSLRHYLRTIRADLGFHVMEKGEAARAGGAANLTQKFIRDESHAFAYDVAHSSYSRKDYFNKNPEASMNEYYLDAYLNGIQNKWLNPDDWMLAVEVPNTSGNRDNDSRAFVVGNSVDELIDVLNERLSATNTYYEGQQHGYYECYLNLENPLIIDANGQNWNHILEDGFSEIEIRVWYQGGGMYSIDAYPERELSIEEIEDIYGEFVANDIKTTSMDVWEDRFDGILFAQYRYNGELFNPEEEGYPQEGSTRFWSDYAYHEGYDGVIFRNLRDIGGASHFTGKNRLSDIYIAFSSNQVKDIRNENPTENPDIRYSVVDEDDSLSQMAYDDAMSDSYKAYQEYETFVTLGGVDEYFKGQAYLAGTSEEGLASFLDALKEPEAVPSADAVFEEDRVRRATSKQDFFNNVNAKWNDRWYTEGEVLDVKSVKKDVRSLVMGVMANSDTDAKYRADIVRRTLIDMRTAYQLMKQDRIELASYMLYQSALNMIDGVEFIRDDTAFQEYKEIRDFLRKYRINAPDSYWQTVEFQDFRKAYYGRLRIGKGNNNIESVYSDCEERWPHLFNESEREKAGLGDAVEDLLQHIGVVVDSNVTPFMEAYSSEEAVSLAYDIADELYDIMAGGERVMSLADEYKERFDKQTKAMKQRHAEAILRERKIREEGIQKERQKFRAYKEKQKEKKYHTKYFEGIKKSHDKLVERLASNTADKHIPEQYKKELARLLAAFDLQTVGSKKREERTGQVAQKTIRMAAIRQALKNIEDKSDVFHVNDSITDLMDELAGIDGKTIDALSVEELHKIDQVLKSLLHEFNHYEKVKVGMKTMQVSDIANAQVQSALRHAQQFGPGNDYYGPIGWMDQIINMDEMTPAYMFKQIDPKNEGLGIMWKEIRRSQDKYIRNTAQISEWIDEITGKYKNKGHLWNKFGNEEIERWRSARYTHVFDLKNGTVKLTPAQMMSLYCLSKRKQAYGHMVGAGVVVAPVSFQAKQTSDRKRKTNRALPVILDDADIKQIVTALTPEQIKVADQLQELMSTKMADMGNEASMNVLGIKLFTEQDYFPIKSDKAALERDLTNEEFENAIRNFGFTKAVQPGARNAIMIEDIFDVVTEHCNNMNLYNAYSETLNDFMKVFNKHSYQEDGSDYSVRQAIAHAYSNKATNFIMEFIKDLNGNTSRGRRTGIENAMNDMLANAKKASVFANIRVLLQQPTAITRAFAVINPKYLKGVNLGDVAKGIIPTVTTEAMQEMFEHCPIALWKSWGYYDINMGRNIEDVIMNEGNWLEELATQAYGKADNITWTAIWQMVKAEMKDTHPEVKEGTDDYWELCNERMSEIVDLTQVVDSPLHRSHAMRSKDFLHKTTTAFMAEPTLTFNMIRDGWVRAREAWKTGKKGEAAKIWGRTVSVVVLQAATVAAAAAVADALRGKNAGGDDDDEDRSLWYINFINNLKDELKIWNKVYYIKDLASIAAGWDNANLALQGWQNLCTGYKQLEKKLYEGSKVPWWKIAYNFFGGVGYFLGVPIKTLMRDGRAVFELLGGELPESLVGEKKTEGVIAEDSALQKARVFKNTTDKSSSSTSSAIKISTEDKWYDYERNPITVRDGSSLDKLLNHFGINLTAAEKNAIAEDQKQKERDKKIADIQSKYADLSGEEKDKKVWSAITSYVKDEGEDSRSFSDMVASGDYGDINEMKQMYLSAGGGEEYFDERVLAESKSALKKSIKYSQSTSEIRAQEHIKDYLLSNGMTEADVSEIVYKSDLAKDMKVAFRLGDKELMLETLEPLVNAGLTYDDLCRLWENRNRMQLSSYKGRYKDKLQSTGSYVWPTQGTITSHFGYRDAPTAGASSNHQAIDIGAPQGTPVVAADGGVIIEAGANGGYGNSIGIKHDDGTITYYNHLYSWNVKVGDTVAQGQQIGQVGSTGISTGPHLDFRIYKNGKYLDPEKYLQG